MNNQKKDSSFENEIYRLNKGKKKKCFTLEQKYAPSEFKKNIQWGSCFFIESVGRKFN